MSTEQNKKMVLSFFEKFSANKMDEALAMLADTGTWWIAGTFPLSGTKTKKEFAELLAGVLPVMPGGIKLTAKSMIAEGDKVAVEATSYGKHVNGKVYSNQYHFVFEFRDGKIQAVREYLDTMHTNDVLCSS
ncbi:MAG: nuclear transport factor 2 family protein [Candidatus Binataceae bacterium]|jgi:ketosteroid isomerase-like protein